MELEVLLSPVETDNAISQINIGKVLGLDGILMELLQRVVRVRKLFVLRQILNC